LKVGQKTTITSSLVDPQKRLIELKKPSLGKEKKIMMKNPVLGLASAGIIRKKYLG